MPISKHRIKAQAGCIRRVILLCLCSSTLALVCADNRVANRSNSTQVVEFPTEITDSNTTTTNVKSTGKQQVEPLAAAPSVTSVHRVWTSTSSGSLDELSPEMIGKLRNDMPFLSAYALRPRLVGGPQVASEELSAALTKQRSAEISRLQPGQLESSAATNAAIRRVPGESLVPKLGDFSEFKVETSSTSKSEHHHKRSTSLKRKPNAPGSKISSPLGSRLSRRSLNRTKKKSNPPSKTRKMSSKGRKKYRKRASRNVRGESSKRRTGSRKRSLKLRDKRKRAKSSLPHRINIIRHGRYIQEQTIGANNDSNVLDVDMRAVGRDTTTTTMLSGSGTKSGDTGGTKGGADSSGVASGARRRPFYENAKPIPTPETNDIDEGDLDRSNPADKADDMRSGSNDANADDLGEDEVLDDDVADEPRRVGDPDVDEEGDTVLVEPKSDGVDDDPPIESAEEDGASEAGNTEDDAETGNDVGTGSSTVPDAGSRRTGRDKPRVRDDEGSENEEDSNVDDRGDERSRGSAGSSGSTDFSGGGGIGATIGGSGGSSGRGAGRESESGSDGNSDDNDNPADRRRVGASPGVEFADGDSAQGGSDGSAAGGSSSSNGSDERDDDSSSAGSSSNSGEKSSGSGREDDVDDRRNDDKSSQDGQEDSIDVRSNGKRLDDSDLDYETEKEADIGRTGSRGVDGRGRGESDDDDLDYRDETDDRSRGDRTNNRKAHPSVGVSNDDERDKDDHERGDKRGHKGTECEDKDHHGDDHHHHHHGIEWLRGAIPGEPGVDYPILSRVNSTDFSCRDQKYPGYYADVESRCQVFHICQADGRQDSFLCPNGTVFSQRTLVCVWWAGSDCEDAPKFYHLNALLYREGRNSNGRAEKDSKSLPTPQEVALGLPRRSGESAEREDSSIDTLIRAMRRRQMGSSSNDGKVANDGKGVASAAADEADDYEDGLMGGNKSNNEANKGARKSIAPDDVSEVQRKTSSRLRSARSSNAPRRIRRASMKQSLPKLRPGMKMRGRGFIVKAKRRTA